MGTTFTRIKSPYEILNCSPLDSLDKIHNSYKSLITCKDESRWCVYKVFEVFCNRVFSNRGIIKGVSIKGISNNGVSNNGVYNIGLSNNGVSNNGVSSSNVLNTNEVLGTTFPTTDVFNTNKVLSTTFPTTDVLNANEVPSTTVPNTDVFNTTKPITNAPNTTVPITIKPSTYKPSTTKPSTNEPSTTSTKVPLTNKYKEAYTKIITSPPPLILYTNDKIPGNEDSIIQKVNLYCKTSLPLYSSLMYKDLYEMIDNFRVDKNLFRDYNEYINFMFQLYRIKRCMVRNDKRLRSGRFDNVKLNGRGLDRGVDEELDGRGLDRGVDEELNGELNKSIDEELDRDKCNIKARNTKSSNKKIRTKNNLIEKTLQDSSTHCKSPQCSSTQCKTQHCKSPIDNSLLCSSTQIKSPQRKLPIDNSTHCKSPIENSPHDNPTTYKFKCTACNKKFLFQDLLNDHLKSRKHLKRILNKNFNNTNNNSTTINKNSKDIQNTNNINILNTNNMNIPNTNNMNIPNTTETKYKKDVLVFRTCTKCKMVFDSRTLLLYHLRESNNCK